MGNDIAEHDDRNSFEYRLREVSNEEIISILRYREHFQPHAVKAAIKEALKRGIINSIDDLDKDEFKPQALPPRSLFPISLNDKQNLAIFKSLCRVFYGFGLIPVIMGIFLITEGSYLFAVSVILIGLFIIIVTYQLERQKKPFLSQVLLAMNIPAMGFAIFKLTATGNPTTMDTVAAVIIILVFLYTSFYLNKLTAHFNKLSDEE
ncbi:MAG: hypothetical protein JW798_14590 [Prolixibacteraceae bacterium]|nr:hypothetical protein [Prolixibacteraceae bacterium]